MIFGLWVYLLFRIYRSMKLGLNIVVVMIDT